MRSSDERLCREERVHEKRSGRGPKATREEVD